MKFLYILFDILKSIDILVTGKCKFGKWCSFRSEIEVPVSYPGMHDQCLFLQFYFKILSLIRLKNCLYLIFSKQFVILYFTGTMKRSDSVDITTTIINW